MPLSRSLISRQIFLAACAILVAACGKDEEPIEPGYEYQVPSFIGDGLEVADGLEAGLDISRLETLMKLIDEDKYINMHSVLLAKDNNLILEEYFPGKPIYGPFTNWGITNQHNMHSVTKSFTSALVGIAVDQGKMDLEKPLLSYFPDRNISTDSLLKLDITLGDALSMSSGLSWDEWSYGYDDPRNDHAAMYESTDWVGFVLGQPMERRPGEKFVYNSGLSITIGKAIENATGLTLGNFANFNLFAPLGIDNYSWQVENNTYQTGGGLRFTPRGMMKFGLLFLNDGEWKGSQLISKEWVELSTVQHGPNLSYAYHWWLTNFEIKGTPVQAVTAAGRGGQYIYIFRDLNLVAVFTSGNDSNSAGQSYGILKLHILPNFY